MILNSGQFSASNRLIQEHFQLVILCSISTLFKPPSLKSLRRVFCLLFAFLLFHEKFLDWL